MTDYFKKEPYDSEFFNEYINPRLPAKVFDFHAHITRPSDCTAVSKEAVDEDWAMQCGFTMTFDDYAHYCTTLWAGRKTEANVFPMPCRGIDLKSSNTHIYELMKSENNCDVKITSAAMCVDPSYDADECEQLLLERGFIGYKPYPDLVAEKGSEIGIFDFLPHKFLKTLDRHKKAVVIHLPRPLRLADKNNIRELLEMRQTYPDIKIVIAHYGRCYNIEYAESALADFGSDIDGFYFDTTAVINPAVHSFMLEHIAHHKIFFGTDLPILRWHGRRTWANKTYHNFSREAFDWNKDSHESPEAEAKYTFLLYEQVRNMLDALEKAGGKQLIEDVFYNNATAFVNQIKNNSK